MPLMDTSKKKTIYRICDNLFRFWLRFVPNQISTIILHRMDQVYEDSIKQYIPEYMGDVFEDMAKEYLLYQCVHLPMALGEVGQWWGNDKVRKQQVEIDIVA